MRILLRGYWVGGATFDFLFCKDIWIYSRKIAFLHRFLNKLTGIVLLFYTSPPKKKQAPPCLPLRRQGGAVQW